jgi:hypothetical protein
MILWMSLAACTSLAELDIPCWDDEECPESLYCREEFGQYPGACRDAEVSPMPAYRFDGVGRDGGDLGEGLAVDLTADVEDVPFRFAVTQTGGETTQIHAMAVDAPDCLGLFLWDFDATNMADGQTSEGEGWLAVAEGCTGGSVVLRFEASRDFEAVFEVEVAP